LLGEYLPFDATLYNGELASSFHNKYPQAWAQIAHEALVEAGNKTVLVKKSHMDPIGNLRSSGGAEGNEFGNSLAFICKISAVIIIVIIIYFCFSANECELCRRYRILHALCMDLLPGSHPTFLVG
jgi:hypothetical protein